MQIFFLLLFFLVDVLGSWFPSFSLFPSFCYRILDCITHSHLFIEVSHLIYRIYHYNWILKLIIHAKSILNCRIKNCSITDFTHILIIRIISYPHIFFWDTEPQFNLSRTEGVKHISHVLSLYYVSQFIFNSIAWKPQVETW